MSPFENINNFNQPKSNLFKMLLFSVLAFAVLSISIFIPFIGIIGLALITIPSVRMMLEGRIWESILCSVLGSSVLFVFDIKTPFLFLALLISVSFIFRFCFLRNKGPFLTIALSGMVFIGLLIIYIVYITVFENPDFIPGFLIGYKEAVASLPKDPIVQGYMKTMSITSEQMELVLTQAGSYLNKIPYLIPSMVIFYIFLSAFISYYWSMIIFRKNGIVLRGIPLFKTWDMPWYLIFGFIAGLILVLIPNFNSGFDFYFDVVGANILIIFGLSYTVIGFAVLWGIFDNLKIAHLWRILIIIAISFSMVLLIIIPIMGILDIWINFRKLERH
ncbi:MAG TPA: DUF2232 domain-containing protein [Actinobacteria bacterium]|nr:DUF2232 domain-containing protein [Actinomycetota bacterium]